MQLARLQADVVAKQRSLIAHARLVFQALLLLVRISLLTYPLQLCCAAACWMGYPVPPLFDPLWGAMCPIFKALFTAALYIWLKLKFEYDRLATYQQQRGGGTASNRASDPALLS